MRRAPTILALVSLVSLSSCGLSSDSTPGKPRLELGDGFVQGLLGKERETTVFLRSVEASSGVGAARLVDGQPATGWSPVGDANGEWAKLAFEQALPSDAMRVRACERSTSFRVSTRINGEGGPSFSLAAGREYRVELTREQSRHGVTAVELRFDQVLAEENVVPCIAEVEFVSDGRTVPIRPPRGVRGRVRASSMVEDGWSHPDFLVDGNPATAWREGGAGTGAGERVLLALDEPMEITGVEVWNGDQRGEPEFAASGRLAALRVEPDGDEPIRVEVRDALGPQRLEFPKPVTAAGLAFVLEGASEGQKANKDVVAWSEFRLLDRYGPVGVLAAVDPHPHALPPDWLDVQWRSVCGYPRRTLKLRSNNRFSYDLPAREGRRDAAPPVLLEGEWAAPAASMPWVEIGVRGSRFEYSSARRASGDEARRVEGVVEVASVEELGAKGVRQVLDAWGREHGDRVDCITEELGAWSDAWKTLLANDALVVRTTGGDLDIVDLVWQERGL